uniref:asparagine synthase (glutamine-hydrolyzing) n=1 Tax=Rheinheimera sp. BAL341 TaxID=1708203 RepID=A0A486XVV5_9GAMM
MTDNIIHNKITLLLKNNFGSYQCIDGDFYIAGKAFLGSDLINPEALKLEICNAIASQNLPQLLKKLNGFYSVIFIVPNGCYLITDKLRSRPLFYRIENGKFLVSDSAEQFLGSSAAKELNKLSAEEFLLTGFVTGVDTLITGVQQVQAGEYIFWQDSASQVKQTCYDMFLPKHPIVEEAHIDHTQSDGKIWYELLDRALIQAMQRLITYSNGRQIVLPLSGGYDSRAIALCLKRLNYTNVVCFTFGRVGSPEIKISKKIAESLGFTLHCIYYSAGTWRMLRKNNKFRLFSEFIHNFVSVPNIQVFPALDILINNKFITEDAVIVPGHTGDFVSGGHMPEPDKVSKCAVRHAKDLICKRHYRLSRSLPSLKLNLKIAENIGNIARYAAKEGVCNDISVVEAWNWRERQAKFIVNSNRYYDFFNLDWWMPLWDNEFVDFWQQVPYVLRKDKKLWINWVENQTSDILGSSEVIGNAEASASSLNLLAARHLNYFFDNNHVFSLMPFTEWLIAKLRFNKQSPSVLGYLARVVLENSKKKLID